MTEPSHWPLPNTHPAQAYDVALMGQGEPPPAEAGQPAAAAAAAPPREVQTGDFIFLIRKDVRRYKRMKVRTAHHSMVWLWWTDRVLTHTTSSCWDRHDR